MSVYDPSPTDRFHLEALAIDDPWCHSQEGLDDGCHFCNGWKDRLEGRIFIRIHEQDCVWIAAMDYLGREHPEHERGERGEVQ